MMVWSSDRLHPEPRCRIDSLRGLMCIVKPISLHLDPKTMPKEYSKTRLQYRRGGEVKTYTKASATRLTRAEAPATMSAVMLATLPTFNQSPDQH